MNKSLKIAIYSGEIPSSTFIERLVNGLSNSNISIYLFGAKYKTINYATSVKVVAYRHNKLSKLLHFLKYNLLLFLFRNEDKKKLDRIIVDLYGNNLYSKVKSYPVLWHRPDVLHVQWAKSLEEWVWVKEFNIRLVLSLRGAHINYSPVADEALADSYRQSFPKVDAFHAVSWAIANEAQRYGAKKDLIKVIYSGLNLQANSFSKSNSIFKIVSVGRPHWVKGYHYALDACNLLVSRGVDFHYEIIGGNSDIELLYHLSDLNLTNHVHLEDNLPFDKVKTKIQSADLLLLPSLKEGVPNVVLEAMALGTLVLTTSCGGISEVITDNYNGFLIPIRDSKKMADVIMEILQLPNSRVEKIIEAAKKTIKLQHTEKQMIESMVALYHSVLTNNAIENDEVI
ncbi:glycosyltransferase family 4 protein [Subsaxibacter sp. CAU 1640]|uniref:glycosyltransferase family 4 protein n=1 Tax=Subsaxibacter sp. CAU 1640 TaxID=2933271 RepID=UPI0020064A4C|nr:glycosyltransferase family 4 protein [Subsaxibacter sp. CAU 1640]MCK7589892.1 glycosyltransferase family 4 protein [Subsaxibacter sp. CAU 1640]